MTPGVYCGYAATLFLTRWKNMGNANSGRKPISEHSAEVKRQLAEIAQKGSMYLRQCADSKVKPSAVKVDIAKYAIDHTIGRPRQQVDTNISGRLTIDDQLAALTTEQLEAIVALAKQKKAEGEAK
mgnify:CR=1 FL=1